MQRFKITRFRPVFKQFGAVFGRPFVHDAGSFDGKVAFEDFPRFYGDKCLEPLVFGVEVSRWMIRVVHADVDAEEIGNDGHGGSLCS